MKILFIHCTDSTGGSSTALINLVQGLIKQNHSCLVLIPKGKGDLNIKLDSLNCQYKKINISLTIHPNSKNPIRYLKRLCCCWYNWQKGYRDVCQAIDIFNPDIVHTNVGPLYYALNYCIKKGIPHVWHLREFQDKDFDMHFYPSQSYFRKIIHKQGNFNIAITNEVFNYWNLNPCKDRVIYDGVFSEKLCGKSLCAKKKDVILFVGRVSEAKGTYDVIKAFNLFHNLHKSYELLIAGHFNTLTSEYCRLCDNYVKNNGLTENVFFLGERTDIFELMQISKALVVPSRFEGFGFITAEAMLNGCTVIGRNTAGTKEQLDNGLNEYGKEIGLRFSNQNQLLDCLNMVVEKDMSETVLLAKEYVERHYTIESHTRNVINFYNMILKSNIR